MATFSQNNIQWFLLGNDTTTSGANRALGINALAFGEVGIFNAGGAKLTNSTAAGVRFMLAAENGASPVTSEIIDPADIKSIKKVTASAAAQQVDIIGFNGAAGSIDVTNDNLYMANVNLNQSLVSNHGGQYLKHSVYRSPSTGATQEAIASGLTDSFIKNFSKEASTILIAERLCDEAGVANTITAGTDATHYTFYEGSKVVVGTIAGVPALGSDEVNATVVAGDFIRTGAATTDAVYKITAVTSGTGATPAGNAMTLTLDIPFQGADVSIAIGSTEYIAAADVATSEMGVKITGVASEFDTGKMHYYPGTSWSLNLRDFGTTTLTNSVAQDPGKGVYEQVAELEFFMQGNGGNTMRAPEPHVFTRRSSAVVGATYDLYEIAYTTKEERGYGAMHAPKHITVAAITGAGTWVNAAGTGFVDTIEKLTGKTF